MDSFHECLQEYGEGLEVVQICLEPEDASIKDEELSALGDLSLDECQKTRPSGMIGDKNSNLLESREKSTMNGNDHYTKSDESLDDPENDDDMTITEDDMLIGPRELSDIQNKSDRKVRFDGNRSLSKQQSKEISTSDEMVFAVTPTGLERISFEKYWKECDVTKEEHVKSDESWKECLNSPTEDSSFYDAKLSVQESNSLLYIDHDIDGYETCLEDDYSVKCTGKTDEHKISNDHKISNGPDHVSEIKVERKQIKHSVENKDNESAKSISIHRRTSNVEDALYDQHPYIQEHIIKQMKSLRIEPLNLNISNKKLKKKSPTKNKNIKRQCVEYYNDQAECLEEYKRQKKLDEDRRTKEQPSTQNRVMEKKMHFKTQQPSDESTDLENYVPGCHKCFLENYAYAITKAYIEEATACKYCEVVREILETPKVLPSRRSSAPAIVNLDSATVSETDEEDMLLVPMLKDRRKSAGPLRFFLPTRQSYSPAASHGVPPTMTVAVCGDKQSAQRWGPARRVVLSRSPGSPLGVSIVGGKVDIISNHDEGGEEKAIFGIFIKNVVPESPAGNSGDLHTGDRILEVDGVCVRSAPHDQAVALIKAAGEIVTLTVQSLLAWNTDSSDVEAPSPLASPTLVSKRKSLAPQSPPLEKSSQHEIKITVTSEIGTEVECKDKDTEESEETEEKESTAEPESVQKQPVYSDSDSSDEEEDGRELGGRTYSDKGIEIDRASAAAIKRSKDEKQADPEEEDDFGYTSNKIRKKYAPLGESVVAVRLERSARAGLGLSLAGHRDRSRMAVFVCGLNPAGAAARASPPVKVGDEILEVNGIVLHGRCHLNASAIIKGLAGPIFKIILLRRKQALEDVAVKPLTQFPVALEEESEDKFSSYKGVRNVSIKKGSSSLGIMIIEGRHAEVGQGIFISDIQEGSAAEQAGLQIGDMILAVNKDSLLGCSYDSAAATLKRTEGVVILTVCNPNKKDDSPDENSAAGPASGSRPTSRNQTPDPGTLKATGPSRPQTPKPVPSPVKAEPPPDPATVALAPNKDTVIELNTQNQSPGLLILGGCDTLINGPAAVILEVYPNGVSGKDGRLKPGDQIVECCGVVFTKEMSRERLCVTIKRAVPKMRMTVHRPDPITYEDIEVDLPKKPGKGLGLCLMARTPGPGVYISDILSGGPADVDGRLQIGDILASVDGKDLSSAEHAAAAAAFKMVTNKASIKVKRFKIVR